MDIQFFKVFEIGLWIGIGSVPILIKFLPNWINLEINRLRLKKENIELLKNISNGKVDWYKRENRLLIEETFEFVYKMPISFEEINILILTDNPKEAITNYLKARPILKVSEDKQHIEYKKYPKKRIEFFSKSFELPVRLIISIILYLVFAYPGAFALIHIIKFVTGKVEPWFTNDSIKEILFTGIPAFLLFSLAIVFFVEGLKFNFAVKSLKKSLKDRIKTPYET